MPSSTFNNLNKEKKQRILNAMIKEFSSRPLSSAQIAPIVKDSRIARGSFYKYFKNIDDAYLYTINQAISDIHQDIEPAFKVAENDPNFYVKQIKDFVDGVSHSQYLDLMRMHFQENGSFVKANIDKSYMKMKPTEWATVILSHETVKTILLGQQTTGAALERFKIIITKILRG